jgi:threonine/homoserine/homoserine lactone efflux protein
VVLFDTATLMAYCIAAIALVIAPGPGQALILEGR